jgi:hypothetical protein
MADARLVSKAIEILEQHGPRGCVSLDEAIETLASFPPFDGMDDEELKPIATAALERRGPPAPPRVGAGVRPGRPVATRPAPDAAMLTAPYRFVTIDDRVVLAQQEVAAAHWGFPIEGGVTGEIEVEWAFETPMLIGVEEGDVSGPMKLGGDYVIPGATLRGMMRAAMGIVCRARLMQVNKHHKYGVRDFTHPLFKEGQGPAAQRLAWPNLGAGWLRKAKLETEEEKKASAERKAQGLSDYSLTPCGKKLVRIRALPASFNHGKPTNNGQWHRDWLGLGLAERYKRAGYAKGKIGKYDLFDFETSAPVNFVPDPAIKSTDATASDHVIPGGAGGRPGWFVFSSNSPSLKNIDAAVLDKEERSPGPGNQKKREYVFFDLPKAQEFWLRQDVIDRFVLINSKPGKTKPKPDGSFAVMAPTLESGRRIPVFYAGDPEHQERGFDMGLTRLFKLSHRNSVGDVLERQEAHKPDLERPDMIEALFGHVYDSPDLGLGEGQEPPLNAARKGRVAFGFAYLTKDAPAAETTVIRTVAMAPRASFAPFYLRGPVKDWTDEALDSALSGKARLAGRKRYFARYPREKLVEAENGIVQTLQSRRSGESAEMESKLRLLRPQAPGGELVFRGKIRLHNVSAEEVGALLWTLTHGGDTAKPYRHMIGRAKNAGAGQARVKSLRVKLTAHPGKGSRADLLKDAEPWETQGADGGWAAPGSQSLGPFLRAFETYMKNSDKNWPQADDIREFLGACDPAAGAGLRSEFLPTPNDFGKLRRRVKADIQNDPAPVTKASDRLLPAPAAAKVERPYGTA